RAANSPRIQEQARSIEHVARKALLPSAIKYVAIFVADVPTGEISTFGMSRVDATQLGIADFAEIIERRECRLVARGKHVYPGEWRRIAKLDCQLICIRSNRGDLDRL